MLLCLANARNQRKNWFDRITIGKDWTWNIRCFILNENQRVSFLLLFLILWQCLNFPIYLAKSDVECEGEEICHDESCTLIFGCFYTVSQCHTEYVLNHWLHMPVPPPPPQYPHLNCVSREASRAQQLGPTLMFCLKRPVIHGGRLLCQFVSALDEQLTVSGFPQRMKYPLLDSHCCWGQLQFAVIFPRELHMVWVTSVSEMTVPLLVTTGQLKHCFQKRFCGRSLQEQDDENLWLDEAVNEIPTTVIWWLLHPALTAACHRLGVCT